MTQLSRRHFGLAALSAPALLGLTATSANADGHAARPAPQLYQASLGNFSITALFDGVVPLGRQMFFGPEASEIDAVLEGAGVEGDVLPAPISAFLLQSEGSNILIDAGFGGLDMFGPGFGRMFDGLAALGLSPDDIDTIVVTHLHPDHVGGLLGPDGPAFANAQIIVPEIEVGFWGDAAMMAQAPAEAQGLFQLAEAVLGAYGDRVIPTAAGTEVASGMTLELSPGHTPGHSHIHIDGGDREMLVIADSIHNVALHTAFPEISFGFDTDSAMAGQSRLALFDRASADNILIAGSHIHFPGFGRFSREGDSYRYSPATWG